MNGAEAQWQETQCKPLRCRICNAVPKEHQLDRCASCGFDACSDDTFPDRKCSDTCVRCKVTFCVQCQADLSWKVSDVDGRKVCGNCLTQAEADAMEARGMVAA